MPLAFLKIILKPFRFSQWHREGQTTLCDTQMGLLEAHAHIHVATSKQDPYGQAQMQDQQPPVTQQFQTEELKLISKLSFPGAGTSWVLWD